jgi:putative N-acetyltransferase (TIGR04045 family)
MPDQSLWGEPVVPFFSPNVSAHIAGEPWQIEGYLALRRSIFVDEQRIFEGSDVDEHDAVSTPIVVIGHVAGMPDEVIGGVRIYPAGDGTWFGGRLGVAPHYRARRVVGTSLIVAAVSTARARDCTRFLATVQEANVAYFERHRFRCLHPVDVCGHPHRLMAADLEAYPPRVAHALRPVDGMEAVAIVRARAAA